MYQYILFDLDGTLTDSREGITKSVQYALDKMGIHEPELKPLERFIGPPLYDEFRRSYGFDDAQAKQAIAFYRERFGVVGWKENMLYNGIPELLKALTDAGKTLSTASSKPAFFIDKIVKYFNIDQYFTVVSGATLDGTIGTKAQVTQQALDRLRVQDLSQAVLVGDRLHDVEGAKQCGIDCIGVTFGFGDREGAGGRRREACGRPCGRAAAAAALNSHKKLSFETAFCVFGQRKPRKKSANYAGFLSYYGAHCAII